MTPRSALAGVREEDVANGIVAHEDGQERSPDLRGGQNFLIGNMPLLNTLLFQNSPGQLAVERLFLAMAHCADEPADVGLVNPSAGGLIWGAETEPFTETPDRQATEHKATLQSAFVGKALADLANDGDDFVDLGDF